MVPMLIAIALATSAALVVNAEDQAKYRAEQEKAGGAACKVVAVERSDRTPLLSEDHRHAAERREFEACMERREKG